VGEVVSGVWLGEAARGEGRLYLLRLRIGCDCRNLENFHGFRRAIWKAVAADAELRSQYTPIDLYFMKKGNAPYVSANDKNGGRIKHEIHHFDEVAKGGCDMDNLVVMTPRRHIKFHRRGN
jgi:hypothetical protein